jgi:hypothetical protein
MGNSVSKYFCKYINSKKDPTLFRECIKHSVTTNTLFKYDDGKYFARVFSTNTFREFFVEPSLIDGTNKDFYEKILIIINKAHDLACKISTTNPEEQTDCSMQHDGELESLINSAMNKIQYGDYDVLEFVSYITYRIATKQI